MPLPVEIPEEPATGSGDGTFEAWLTCWTETDSMCYDEDPTGEYSNCYNYNENCEDPNWYDCYHNK